MNSLQFFTKALLHNHHLVLRDFFGREHGVDGCRDIIDGDLADTLADEAHTLAIRLTIRWENALSWDQVNDDNPESEARRANSTVDLNRPFILPPNTCPDCGGLISDDDDHTEPVTFNGNQNRVQ
jgi:hypothetical protein